MKRIPKGKIRNYFIGAVIFIALETMFEVIIPFLMAQIIDDGIMKQDESIFLAKGLQMLICAGLSLLFGIIYARMAASFTSELAAALRRKEYQAIQRFAFENLDHFERSSLITRLTNDVTTVQNALISAIRPLVRGPVMLITGMVMAFLIDARMAWIYLVILPFLGLVLYLIVRNVRPKFPRLQAAMDAVNERIQENLTAIRIVKAFVRQDYEAEKFETVNSQLADISRDTFKVATLNIPAFQAAMYTTIVALIYIGMQMIFGGTLQVGELTGLLSYVLQIMNSLVMISSVFLLLTRSMASINRIEEVFNEKVTLTSPEDGKFLKDGSVNFHDVSFKYDLQAEEDVLSHINWSIKSGQNVGIIGATGSAKSTLVALIPRLYDASQGAVEVGGYDVKELNLNALRDDVAMVLQNNVLFTGTIAENLRWGDPDAEQKDLDRACRIACADEFIQRLPDGYQTQISQSGSNLSGGQKQRLCIARALLKKPKILILDDSTSAVDTKTDRRIRDGLSRLPMTVIMIAQRISSIASCDQILVLEDGKVRDIGTHDELLKSSSIYHDLYLSQKRGDPDAAA